METVRSRFEITRQVLQKAGPYLLIEVLLPGGSLVAAMLYLYRRKRAKASGASESLVGPMRVFLARVLAAGCVALAGCGGPALVRQAQPLESSAPLAEAKDERIRVAIDTVILRNGPGAWARDAEWDEYLIRIRALSDESVEIRQIAVFDAFDHRIEPRVDHGELVNGTREMERRYGDSGKLVKGAYGSGGLNPIRLFFNPLAALAVVPVVVVAATVDHFVKKAQVNSEIQRRRTTLPVALAIGAEADVDLFFPITPQSGRAQIVYADRHGEHRLDIDTRQALVALQPPPPTLVSRVDPEFPWQARFNKGYVTARLALDKEGRVRGVEVIESVPPGVFDREARRAFHSWTYSKSRHDDRIVEAKLEFKR